jgi:DNA invertase Pin-like site-specific DNA recombinase
MEPTKASSRCCAIYTRKSSEEGLEQDFNSLHAQREACEAFIKSQAGEGWRPVKTAYDDGGLSGGTMERPALQRLLADIDQGLIDVVVVYKVDRLTRSLADFAKMVEVFDTHGVSFVAVTQQFNTTTSMGRLTLNVLLSFAQFEREVTGERIRDKIAASKRKGMWMGGCVPLGYDISDRRIVIDEREAESVRYIFRRYEELGCVRLLKEDLDRRGVVSKRRTSKTGTESGAHSFSRGALYALLSNPIYVGEIRHKNLRYPGQHQAIVDRAVWERTQQQLQERRVRTKSHKVGVEKSPLIGDWSTKMAIGLRPVTHANERESTATTCRATSRPREPLQRASASVCLQENSKVESLPRSGKCSMTSLLFLKPHRRLATLAESNEYSTRHAAGAAYFNRKPNKLPRLPRWSIGWSSNLTA